MPIIRRPNTTSQPTKLIEELDGGGGGNFNDDHHDSSLDSSEIDTDDEENNNNATTNQLALTAALQEEILHDGEDVTVEQRSQRVTLNGSPLSRGRPLFIITSAGRFLVILGSSQLFVNTLEKLRDCKVEFPADGVALVKLYFNDNNNMKVTNDNKNNNNNNNNQQHHHTNPNIRLRRKSAFDSTVKNLEVRFARKDGAKVLSTLSHMVTKIVQNNLVSPTTSSSSPAAAPPSSAGTTRTLVLAHFNDTYNLNPTSMQKSIVGGASRFNTVLKSLREAGKHPMVVFSGDFMGPSLMSVEMKGRQIIDCFNLIGVDFASLGNHEFDYTTVALKEALWGTQVPPFTFNGSSTTWVSTNLLDSKTLKPCCGCEPYSIVKWGDVRVGIMGLVENWLNGCSRLKPGELKYLDVFEVGERVAKELKHRGAEFVIALTHCRLGLDKQVSARCPSIDLILGGHDHFYKSIPKARLVKSGEEFKFLTEITVTFRQGVTQPTVNVEAHAIVGSIPACPQMEALIKNYDDRVKERMGVVVGVTAVTLDPTEEAVRFKEGYLTAFFCDLMVEETNSDIALLGGAAVAGKRELPPGPVTTGDILEWFPGNPKVMYVRLNGKTLRKLLATMAKDCPAEAPSFPHCSSRLRFVINVFKKPAAVEDIMFDNAPLKDDQSFVVALEDFAAKGKGHYSFLKTEAEQLVHEEASQQLVDWVKEFFIEKKGQQKSMVGGGGKKNNNKESSSSGVAGGDGDGRLTSGGGGNNNTSSSRFNADNNNNNNNDQQKETSTAEDLINKMHKTLLTRPTFRVRRNNHHSTTATATTTGSQQQQQQRLQQRRQSMIASSVATTTAASAAAFSSSPSTTIAGGAHNALRFAANSFLNLKGKSLEQLQEKITNRFPAEHLGSDSWLESLDKEQLKTVYATLSQILEPCCESIESLITHADSILRRQFACERTRFLLNDEEASCLKHYNGKSGRYINSIPVTTGGIAGICVTRRVVMRTNDTASDDFFDPDEDTLFDPSVHQNSTYQYNNNNNNNAHTGGGGGAESSIMQSNAVINITTVKRNDIKNMLSSPGNFQEQSVFVIQLINKFEMFGGGNNNNTNTTGKNADNNWGGVFGDIGGDEVESETGDGTNNNNNNTNTTMMTNRKANATTTTSSTEPPFNMFDCEFIAFLTRQLAQHVVATQYYLALVKAESSTRQLIAIASNIVDRSITHQLTDVMLEVQTRASELLQCERCNLFLVQSGGGSLFGVLGSRDLAYMQRYNNNKKKEQQQQQQSNNNADNNTNKILTSAATNITSTSDENMTNNNNNNNQQQKELEFRDATVGIIGSVVTSGQSITVPIASDHEDYKKEFDERLISPDSAVMIMPLQSSRGRDVIIGALVCSMPRHPQTRFLVQDERLGSDFATFCSISIEQCYEVQRLHVSKEGMLQAFPTMQMERITIKAGWQTVRNWVAHLRRTKRIKQEQAVVE